MVVTATKDAKIRQNHNRLLLGGFLCVCMHIVARPHPPALPAAKAAFQRPLHAWYRGQHRRLPWRVTPSLYRTVVSEFMLQQTQVKTVLPYFERWVRALPDFAALAAASEARVLKLWEGLGYYSRARNLHGLARVLAARPAPPRDAVTRRTIRGLRRKRSSGAP